jgi:hypothetical protein
MKRLAASALLLLPTAASAHGGREDGWSPEPAVVVPLLCSPGSTPPASPACGPAPTRDGRT